MSYRRKRAISNVEMFSSRQLPDQKLEQMRKRIEEPTPLPEVQQKKRGVSITNVNSIEALRARKHAAEKTEEMRREIDEEERKIQADIQEKILLSANQQIFQQNDRVRRFISTMQISDVMQERSLQLKLKKEQEKIKQQIEQSFVEQMRENALLEEKKIQEKKLKLENKQAEQKSILKQQLIEMKEKHMKQIIDDQIEGERLINQLEEKQRIEQLKQKQRREREYENKMILKKANQDLQIQKQLDKEKERKSMIEIDKYAEKQLQIQEIKKIKEKIKLNEQLQLRQQLFDLQVQKLKEQKNNDEIILKKNKEELENKYQKQEQEKQLKKDQLYQRCLRVNAQSVERKKYQKQIDLDEGKFIKEYWDQQNEKIKQKDEQVKREIKYRSMDLERQQKQQIELRMIEREKNFVSVMDEDERVKQKLDIDNVEFENWAKIQIKNYQDQGKDSILLVKELQKIQKND